MLGPDAVTRIRFGLANALACIGCSFMALLIAMLIYKAATNQLVIPTAIYVGLGISVALLLLGGAITGTRPGKAFLIVAVTRILFALLLQPFLATLASAFDHGNWAVAVALIVLAIAAAQPTIGFVPKYEDGSVDVDGSAL